MKKETDNDIVITSVSQFVEEVTKIGVGKYRARNIFFRGEADFSWEPKASLLRKDLCDPTNADGGVYLQMEYDLIREAQKINPSMFASCHNSMDKLVMMQHYGLPTRLLDVTANPLIALFFACESEMDKDGKVLFIQKEPLDGSIANMIATLCEYYESSIYENTGLWNFLAILKEHHLYIDEMKRQTAISLFENITKSFLYVHPYINERIKMQKGAFIFSAYMQPVFSKNKYKRILENIGAEWLKGEKEIKSVSFNKESVSAQNEFNKRRFIIKRKYKEKILKDLDLLGINEAFVYPEPEHQMRYVKNAIINSTISIKDFYSK